MHLRSVPECEMIKNSNRFFRFSVFYELWEWRAFRSHQTKWCYGVVSSAEYVKVWREQKRRRRRWRKNEIRSANRIREFRFSVVPHAVELRWIDFEWRNRLLSSSPDPTSPSANRPGERSKLAHCSNALLCRRLRLSFFFLSLFVFPSQFAEEIPKVLIFRFFDGIFLFRHRLMCHDVTSFPSFNAITLSMSRSLNG